MFATFELQTDFDNLSGVLCYIGCTLAFSIRFKKVLIVIVLALKFPKFP